MLVAWHALGTPGYVDRMLMLLAVDFDRLRRGHMNGRPQREQLLVLELLLNRERLLLLQVHLPTRVEVHLLDHLLPLLPLLPLLTLLLVSRSCHPHGLLLDDRGAPARRAFALHHRVELGPHHWLAEAAQNLAGVGWVSAWFLVVLELDPEHDALVCAV